MHPFLVSLFLFFLCKGSDGYTYPPTPITYAGMTIECTEGCGLYGDPNLDEISSILDRTIYEAFGDVFTCSEIGDGELLRQPVTWECETFYKSWDWESANGIWPSDEDLISYKEVAVDCYPNFLEAASHLRADVHYYYSTAPRRIREFETRLIQKLKEGLTQGYTIYMIHPGGDLEFDYGFSRLCSLDPGWAWIDVKLNSLSDHGFALKENISFRNEKYKDAKALIEKSIAEIDMHFQSIFVYCLMNHQPEGIAFSTAIEALLDGNLEEGIEHIRKLIEIGEATKFPSEIMGKMQLLKGQLELEASLYGEAIFSLTQAIAKNPLLKEAYLERASAYFELGKYDHSLENYLNYSSSLQSLDPFSITNFSLAFSKQLIPGICESGRGLYLLLSDLIHNPIHTASLIWESFSSLSKLVAGNEWSLFAEALAPEVHYLIVNWDTLSSEKRGELAGYAFGKYGADLLIPGALAKAVSKGMKCGSSVSCAYKSLRAADQTLLFESLAELKSAVKIEEVVVAARETAFLGEELGFSSREMFQLKQAGKLEDSIHSSLEKLVSQSESEVLKEAMNQNKHVKMVVDYLEKPAKEVQKGINSYEKQIAIHSDKIANPIKYYPNWEKLDLRQREALINKKWPAEIKVYEEQKNILQSILNERLSYD